MSDLSERIDNACSDLRNELEGDGWTDEPHDLIFELADQAVPIYHSDILQAANEYNNLATVEPELGPAFDGSPTPVNIIAANIFEMIEAELWETYRELEKEREEDESLVN